MDNYEINILRRDGNWKKVKPDDLIINDINNDQIENNEPNQKKSQNNFLSNLSKVESIISRLESLEKEKSALKEELKEFEDNFLRKKKLAEDEINKISQEKDIIEKTLNVIKNLKSF
jgi:predicted  nucleic acid-binding Zn-ribbon protein